MTSLNDLWHVSTYVLSSMKAVNISGHRFDVKNSAPWVVALWHAIGHIRAVAYISQRLWLTSLLMRFKQPSNSFLFCWKLRPSTSHFTVWALDLYSCRSSSLSPFHMADKLIECSRRSLLQFNAACMSGVCVNRIRMNKCRAVQTRNITVNHCFPFCSSAEKLANRQSCTAPKLYSKRNPIHVCTEYPPGFFFWLLRNMWYPVRCLLLGTDASLVPRSCTLPFLLSFSIQFCRWRQVAIMLSYVIPYEECIYAHGPLWR